MKLSLGQNLVSSRHYREFLRLMIAEGGKKRGYKQQLASFAGCQPAYLSQVLASKAELTPEQAEKLCVFWGLGEAESEIFFHLVLLGRAGTPSLRERLEGRLARLRKQWRSQKDTFEAPGLSESDRALSYYHRWTPSAVHVLLTVPDLQTVPALAKHLGLTEAETEGVLRQLERIGLAARSEGRWKATQAVIHSSETDASSDLHHRNWRLRALERGERPQGRSVRYTSVHSLSRADVVRIRDILDQAIRETRAVIEPSPEETGACLIVDYFELGT